MDGRSCLACARRDGLSPLERAFFIEGECRVAIALRRSGAEFNMTWDWLAQAFRVVPIGGIRAMVNAGAGYRIDAGSEVPLLALTRSFEALRLALDLGVTSRFLVVGNRTLRDVAMKPGTLVPDRLAAVDLLGGTLVGDSEKRSPWVAVIRLLQRHLEVQPGSTWGVLAVR
jgi:hypothetical protein